MKAIRFLFWFTIMIIGSATAISAMLYAMSILGFITGYESNLLSRAAWMFVRMTVPYLLVLMGAIAIVRYAVNRGGTCTGIR